MSKTNMFLAAVSMVTLTGIIVLSLLTETDRIPTDPPEGKGWEEVCRQWTDLAQANDSTIKSVTLTPVDTLDTDDGIQYVIQTTLHGKDKDLIIYLFYNLGKEEITGMRFRTPEQQKSLDELFYDNNNPR